MEIQENRRSPRHVILDVEDLKAGPGVFRIVRNKNTIELRPLRTDLLHERLEVPFNELRKIGAVFHFNGQEPMKVPVWSVA